MEEPVTLDSGEGTLEHSTHHLPQPPPRHESYMLKNADGSGSENYEHLPTRSLSSLNGGDDNNINFNLNDNNEKYPHLYMLGEKDMGIDDSYLNDDDKDDKSRLIHQGKCKTQNLPFIYLCFSVFTNHETQIYAYTHSHTKTKTPTHTHGHSLFSPSPSIMIIMMMAKGTSKRKKTAQNPSHTHKCNIIHQA